MFIKQLSVFMENRPGRLEKVTEVLSKNEINIVSMSMSDTSEYGLLRVIVSDPLNAKVILMENGFSAVITDVIAVKLSHRIGMLADLLHTLHKAELNVEYMYVLSTRKDSASVVVKASDPETAVSVLKAANLEILEEESAYVLNQ